MKKVIHVSGYSLAEAEGDAYYPTGEKRQGMFHDWETVCWGNRSRGALGRIPMGLWFAQEVNASAIIWSTGSTKNATGTSEAQIIYNRALNSYHELLRDFPHRFNTWNWRSETEYRAWLEKISILETASLNTSSSLVEARSIIWNRFGLSSSVVYLVSSANHMPRVMRDAMVAFGIGTNINAMQESTTLVGVAAETNYGHKYVSDTIVKDLGN